MDNKQTSEEIRRIVVRA